MKTYVEMYKNICRVCLSYKNSDDMVLLTDINSEDGLSCFGKAVLSFANISLSSDDNLPSSMCFNCLKLLKFAIHFKLKCEKSHRQLNEWFETYNSSIDCQAGIEEIIVQNIMFSHHFPKESLSATSQHDSSSKTGPVLYINVNSDEDSCISHNEEYDMTCNDTDSDVDYSADEILDTMEKNITQYTCIDNTTSLQKKLQRIKVDNKKFSSQKRLVARKSLKLKRKWRNSSRKSLTTDEDFTCNICKKNLANRSTYRYHMQRHTGCNLICEHCGKGFPVLSDLQLHQVTLHGIGPHLQCKFCNFKAPKKFILTEHERLHTGEKPYTCDKCGLAFRRQAQWKKHLIYHTEKTVQCPHCPRKFFIPSEMKAHVNHIHERMYMYVCHKCDVIYAKPSTVRRHLTERHGIPREMQGKIIRVNKGRIGGFSV